MRNCESVKRASLASNERVNYTFGMVLGEVDFRQEQEHFEWKHRISNALLHGYGTVCGLRVTVEPTADPADVKIRVGSGYGISPSGNWIWVQSDQCAQLGAWIEGHADEIGGLAAPGSHRVYVGLCYDECLVTPVPIAGRPCASGEDTQAPSRVREAFQAQFSWDPPAGHAGEVYRQLGEVLDLIEIIDGGSPPTDDRDLLLDFVRDLGLPSSPPSASPPATVQLAAGTAEETMRQVSVIWATTVCPRLLESTLNATKEEDCILLAHVDFDVDAQGDVLPGTVTVDDRDRPVIASTRFQQELNSRFRIGVPV